MMEPEWKTYPGITSCDEWIEKRYLDRFRVER